MKTIFAMWCEYIEGLYPIIEDRKNLPFKKYEALMKAFYAGFNQCYCVANEGHGIRTDRVHAKTMEPHPYLEIPQYEKEMDDASEGKYGGKV